MTENIEKSYWLGLDGGGTNCRTAIINKDNVVVGEGHGGPANFIRVGLDSAIEQIKLSINQACEKAGIKMTDINTACLGLAGVSPPDHHRRMSDALKDSLPIENIILETDARIALAGATDNKPGIVIIAGTGSIACGVNSRGRFARAGGWGPTMGDEGSGSYIGKRALEAVMMAYDYRGGPTAMLEPVLKHFGVASPSDLPPAVYDNPTEVMGKIAQLSKIVVDAAASGDSVAVTILKDSAVELAKAVIAVIDQLRMEKEFFRVAYVGGVFEAGSFILKPLEDEIKKFAPNSVLGESLATPVMGAAKMARS